MIACPHALAHCLGAFQASLATARPGAAHRALATLEAKGIVTQVVTTNIDMLHELAGSEHVSSPAQLRERGLGDAVALLVLGVSRDDHDIIAWARERGLTVTIADPRPPSILVGGARHVTADATTLLRAVLRRATATPVFRPYERAMPALLRERLPLRTTIPNPRRTARRRRARLYQSSVDHSWRRALARYRMVGRRSRPHGAGQRSGAGIPVRVAPRLPTARRRRRSRPRSPCGRVPRRRRTRREAVARASDRPARRVRGSLRRLRHDASDDWRVLGRRSPGTLADRRRTLAGGAVTHRRGHRGDHRPSAPVSAHRPELASALRIVRLTVRLRPRPCGDVVLWDDKCRAYPSWRHYFDVLRLQQLHRRPQLRRHLGNRRSSTSGAPQWWSGVSTRTHQDVARLAARAPGLMNEEVDSLEMPLDRAYNSHWGSACARATRTRGSASRSTTTPTSTRRAVELRAVLAAALLPRAAPADAARGVTSRHRT